MNGDSVNTKEDVVDDEKEKKSAIDED